MGDCSMNTSFTDYCICRFQVWNSRSDHMWRRLCRTAELWAHQSCFWLNPWQTRINSGRFTSSEIHECPARPSFAATLDNVVHNIEFQPVCEFELALSQAQHARGAYSQKLLTQRASTQTHGHVQILRRQVRSSMWWRHQTQLNPIKDILDISSTKNWRS